MQIKLSSIAFIHLQEIIDSHLKYCGKQSAMKLSHQIDDKLRTLTRFPESGAPEELLAGRLTLYRAKLINKRYKMIYHISGDVILVDAFWDMRMDPNSLLQRI